MQANYMLAKDPLSLDRIRSILTRLEDTIIFSLIERAQFAHNPRIYDRGVFKELEALGFKGSWLEWFLKETETFHGAQYIFPHYLKSNAHLYLSKSTEVHKVVVFLFRAASPSDLQISPDEYPFTTGLPAPILPPPEYPPILYPNKVNANASILSFYVRSIVPRITVQATLVLASLKRSKRITGDDELEDDGNYGSAATVDVDVLHAISKRVHYGLSSLPLSFQCPTDELPRQVCIRVEI